MEIKVQLAELCAAYSLPMERFRETSPFLNLEKEPLIIEKIENYHLPEITKLICGSDSLQELQWAAKYKNIRAIYCKFPDIDVPKILLSYKTPTEFETDILRFADKAIIDLFAAYFEELKGQLAQCRKERTSIKKEIKKYSEREKAEQNESEISDETLKEKNDYQVKLEVIERKITQLNSFLKKEKAFSDKIEDYVQKLSDEEDDSKRSAVYNMLQTPQVSQAEVFVNSFIQNGSLTPEDEQLFRDEGFVTRLLIYLDSESMRDYAMPVLMKLYDEGVIDLVEGPASDFIARHPDLLCMYLIAKIPAIKEPTEEEELLLEKALIQDQRSEMPAFTDYWNRLPDQDSWMWLIRKIFDLNPDENINIQIGHMMHGLTDNAGKLLADALFCWTDKSIPVDPMEIYAEWMKENKIPGRSQLLEYVHNLDQNSRKVQRRLNTAERRIRCQGQEIFSSLYRPMEQLEELAVSLRYTKGEVKAGLVSSSLMEIVTELREGLETLDIQPLADIDDWKFQNSMAYDPQVHRMTAHRSGASEKVKVSSLGFRYMDEDGIEQRYHANAVIVENKQVRKAAERRMQQNRFAREHENRIPKESAEYKVMPRKKKDGNTSKNSHVSKKGSRK